MQNLQIILCALGGFALGTLAAFMNSRISERVIKKNTVSGVMGTNMIRLVVDFATLALVFFACRLLELPLSVTLIATALGLTVCGMLFLKKLADRILEEEKKEKQNGGE